MFWKMLGTPVRSTRYEAWVAAGDGTVAAGGTGHTGALPVPWVATSHRYPRTGRAAGTASSEGIGNDSRRTEAGWTPHGSSSACLKRLFQVISIGTVEKRWSRDDHARLRLIYYRTNSYVTYNNTIEHENQANSWLDDITTTQLLHGTCTPRE